VSGGSGQVAVYQTGGLIIDSFTRVTSGKNWGLADFEGLSWDVSDANPGSDLAWDATVEGTYGRLWSEANPGTGDGADPRASLLFVPFSQTFAMSLRMKFVSFDTATVSVFVDVTLTSGSGGSGLNFTFGDGIYLTSAGVGGTTRLDFDPVPGVWYRIRLEQEEDVELRTKVWEESGSEPEAWTLSKDVAGQIAWFGTEELRFDCDQISGDVAVALEVHFDDIVDELFQAAPPVVITGR
jgi:hypothetical protein